MEDPNGALRGDLPSREELREREYDAQIAHRELVREALYARRERELEQRDERSSKPHWWKTWLKRRHRAD